MKTLTTYSNRADDFTQYPLTTLEITSSRTGDRDDSSSKKKKVNGALIDMATIV